MDHLPLQGLAVLRLGSSAGHVEGAPGPAETNVALGRAFVISMAWPTPCCGCPKTDGVGTRFTVITGSSLRSARVTRHGWLDISKFVGPHPISRILCTNGGNLTDSTNMISTDPEKSPLSRSKYKGTTPS